jgi:hypothetical protein
VRRRPPRLVRVAEPKPDHFSSGIMSLVPGCSARDGEVSRAARLPIGSASGRHRAGSGRPPSRRARLTRAARDAILGGSGGNNPSHGKGIE